MTNYYDPSVIIDVVKNNCLKNYGFTLYTIAPEHEKPV